MTTVEKQFLLLRRCYAEMLEVVQKYRPEVPQLEEVEKKVKVWNARMLIASVVIDEEGEEDDGA